MRRGTNNTYEGRPCKHGHGTIRYIKSNYCTECVRLGNKKLYSNETGFIDQVARAFKTAYNITIVQYYALVQEQRHKCKICGRAFKSWKISKDEDHRDAHVDHDHSTGEVKGILCGVCNRGIEVVRKHSANVAAYLS